MGGKFPGRAGQPLSAMLGRSSDAYVKCPICQPAAIVCRIIRSSEAIVMLINEPCEVVVAPTIGFSFSGRQAGSELMKCFSGSGMYQASWAVCAMTACLS